MYILRIQYKIVLGICAINLTQKAVVKGYICSQGDYLGLSSVVQFILMYIVVLCSYHLSIQYEYTVLSS